MNTDILQQLKYYRIPGQVFSHISAFSESKIASCGSAREVFSKSLHSVVPLGSILGFTLFLLYINGLHDDVICNIAIMMIPLSTLNVIELLICELQLNS